MEDLQNDVVSLPGRELTDLLRHATADHPDPTQKLLVTWDGIVSRDSAAAALYEVWLDELTKAVMHKAAPERIWNMLGNWPPNQMLSRLSHPSAEVFGPNAELGRDAVLLKSLDLAAARLTKLKGPDVGKWSWGKSHVARFRHPLDQAHGGEALMDLGPIPRPGDEYTVNATGYNGSFQQTGGASYRQILDLSDWNRSVAINVPGQSGQPGSPHYSDLLPLWSTGQYFPLAYSRSAVEKVTTDRLVLEP
jgi:penicillin amidase